MSKLDSEILDMWKQLTHEDKQMILRRIREKASGIHVEPIKLEDLHPRTQDVKHTS